MTIHESIAKAKGLKFLRPAVFQESRVRASGILSKLLDESDRPSEGLFYVVKCPDGWKLITYRFDEFPEIVHENFWSSYVAAYLAYNWARVLKQPAAKLEQALKQHPYGFPRGRVSNQFDTNHYGVWQSGDFLKMVSKNTIAKMFSLNNPNWEYDEHERCLNFDYQGVRKILHIDEEWPFTYAWSSTPTVDFTLPELGV